VCPEVSRGEEQCSLRGRKSGTINDCLLTTILSQNKQQGKWVPLIDPSAPLASEAKEPYMLDTSLGTSVITGTSSQSCA